MYLQIFLAVLIWSVPGYCSIIKVGQVDFDYSFTKSGIKFEATNGTRQILSGVLNNDVDTTGVDCEDLSCNFGSYSLNVSQVEDGLHVVWESGDLQVEFSDCFDFGTAHWYGGPQRGNQRWPVEKLQVNGNEPYTINADFPVAERYWLNSNGAYIFLEDKVPLFVEQNVHIHNKVCFNARLEAPYIRRTRNILEYYLVFKNDPKQAHLDAVNNYLGKPKTRPSEIMIKEPIWSTWAKYKGNINETVVLNYGKDIRKHGHTDGQLEIDAHWETCYGSQEFSKETFPNILDLIAQLKAMDYRVTLWVHPFVNSDCQNYSNEGYDRGYFVRNTSGSTNGSWGAGDTHMIDFTKPAAADWFSGRLGILQNDIGIDGFKCDDGEVYNAPQPAVYENVDQERVPNIQSESYLRTCAKFGELIEVKVAYRTQDLSVFVRMRDKHSTWGEDTGLYTVVTTLLQLNMNGYPIVLPDYIAGNGYRNVIPDAELFVRWTQANALMPTMQFSYLPWDFPSDDFDTAAIVKSFVEFHSAFSPKIMEAMDNSIKNGSPVNPPIWWIDPTDGTALGCDDEFLLGDSVLVAPVIENKARSRDVYLPKGQWLDGNTGETFEGPTTLKDYPAPIEVLPYFHKIG